MGKAGRPRVTTTWDLAEITRLYRDENVKVPQIAERMGCSSITVYEYLRDNNVPRYPIGRQRQHNPSQMTTASRERYQLAYSLRMDGYTLEEIAEELDVTRQRIEQIIAKMRVCMPQQWQEIQEYIAERKKVLDSGRELMRLRFNVSNFRRQMLAWLMHYGFQLCWKCNAVKVSADDFSPKSRGRGGRLCRACNTKRQVARYHDPASGLKDYSVRYAKEHPEVQARASKKWHDKNKDKINARLRERWANDPEWRNKKRQQWSDYWKKRYADDPAFREKRLEAWRKNNRLTAIAARKWMKQ